MGAVLFVGGMKSGKSLYAEEYALQFPAPRLYIATAELIDKETKRRVESHKKRRGDLFETVEEPLYPEKLFSSDAFAVLMLDCLTHWYNNLFYYTKTASEREKRLKEFLSALKKSKKEIVLVANEVGWGIVPDNKLAREFIDFSGKANQRIQKLCKEAYLVAAGAKIRIK